MTSSVNSEVHVDNDLTRVTEWRLASNAATGFHRHEYNYVIVPLTTGRLKVTGQDGQTALVEMITGKSYYRELGVEHDVINPNDFEFAFVEIELK